MGRKSCSYFGCKHAKGLSSCRLHKLPSDKNKCRIWMRASGINGTPRKLPAYFFFCSCHFVGKLGPTKENPFPVRCELLDFEINPKTYAPTPDKDEENERNDNDFGVDGFEVPLSQEQGSSGNVSSSFEGGRKLQQKEESYLDFEINPKAYAPTPDKDEKNERNDNDFGVDSFEVPLSQEQGSSGSVSSSFEGGRKLQQREESDLAATLPPTPSTSFTGDEVKAMTPPSFHVHKKRKGAEAEIISDAALPIKQFHDMEIQCSWPFFMYEKCVSIWTDDQFTYFTGISKNAFHVLYDFCGGDKVCSQLKYKASSCTPQRLREASHSPRSQLFLTLLRLRRGYPLADLSLFSSLSITVLSDMFHAWIRLMSIHFKSLEEVMFVSVESQKDNQPDCYKPFKNLRCVVDTTVIKIQKPENFDQQSNTFCLYKGSNAVKVLIATSLYGGCAFVSDCVEGSMSDRRVFLKSGIMDFLNPGEAVMCDRGFDIAAELNEADVDLIMPPFLGNRNAFTEREMALCKAIATSRIHVETFIGRLKFFRLIRYTVPNTLLDLLSDIVRVCACLVNFSNPFIKWHTEGKKKSSK